MKKDTEKKGKGENTKGKIKILKDGPYLVSGSIPLTKETIVTGKDGDPLKWEPVGEYPVQETYALCRCGQSKKKPYCDGTHTKIGFDGTEEADFGSIAFLVFLSHATSLPDGQSQASSIAISFDFGLSDFSVRLQVPPAR